MPKNNSVPELVISTSDSSHPIHPDSESGFYLGTLAARDRIRVQRIPGVRTVLIVLSAKGMVFDIEGLRQKVVEAYPEAAVFFTTPSGIAVGSQSPEYVDLLIDFTGPGQRQGLFYPKKLRRVAKFAVGRNAGLFRKRIYDRVYDEKAEPGVLPKEGLAREREIQKRVLALVGIVFVPTSSAGPDLGKSIALELPPLLRS